ncbi:hypothetical protein ACJIZ3_014400 [Penstemon smallii]|uniref:F-box domain-containing protein n=1 Tax=Penstemon smallii TaxID=265156 RepID=A0ABD3RJG1_9LAMI
MLSDLFGSSLLLALPDDVFAVVTRSLSPRDVCSLGFTSRDLHNIVASDKVWLAQCNKLGLVPCKSLIEWRKGVSSYKVICRFLVNIQPLLGIWVHQNPELGNVVYVMPGFLSVVGCRIIPQEVGPLGLEHGPTLWSPVFEILCNYEGSTTFFLHGRERGEDFVYPGLLKSVDRTCNVLLLEVEPRHQKNESKLAHSKSFAHQVDNEISRRLDSGFSKSQRIVGQKGKFVMPFSRLGFGDRRRLLDLVTTQARLNVLSSTNMLLFPLSRNNVVDLKRDLAVLYERRLLLLDMHTRGCMLLDLNSTSQLPLKPVELESNDSTCTKSKGISGFLKNGLKQILGKSSSTNGSQEFQKTTSSSYESKHLQLHDFLQSGGGSTIGLSLRATTMKLSSYRAWPNMNDSRFALYKLPMWAPKAHHEFSGLWGGTFGWPPGGPTEDKLGKALFFILISYDESEGKEQLIGTKILEGTSYVLHPNGSAMFIVNTAHPSTDSFPWDTDEDTNPVYVRQSFMGEGITNGYGFRYPGSKPGSLFVIRDGLLVFVWKESRSVLTLRRLDLTELLKRGERVPPLSPVSNFAYLMKTYSNVFSGFSNS